MKVKMKGTIDIDWMEVPEKMAKEFEKLFNRRLSVDVELEQEVYDEDK